MAQKKAKRQVPYSPDKLVKKSEQAAGKAKKARKKKAATGTKANVKMAAAKAKTLTSKTTRMK
ncbi:hypothetical protein VP409E501_P0003 [Vibrio phage 409E50-1]|nr:hypothetical protein VP521E561_P0003 [Vibrio phage 521E56-1]CAH9011481.1 hypothetical protein VP402E501_P0003 [Vibrio phage 402E50-1]CAH9011494.1 hypothetical protein VP384E501_P0003 [Vibrio phage 384E50-1]CAH9011518.1 hypothetical protein VP409E501_P0003 [Vibrio phage 409E50-1]CAH9012970.1 hypothetical protein VP405E501_P0003 [Vibrio phage 405E50-1]CAH9013022.1 hypothetical protein VP413E501_P0003 [Vibrio phage 413E50-1]